MQKNGLRIKIAGFFVSILASSFCMTMVYPWLPQLIITFILWGYILMFFGLISAAPIILFLEEYKALNIYTSTASGSALHYLYSSIFLSPFEIKDIIISISIGALTGLIFFAFWKYGEAQNSKNLNI